MTICDIGWPTYKQEVPGSSPRPPTIPVNLQKARVVPALRAFTCPAAPQHGPVEHRLLFCEVTDPVTSPLVLFRIVLLPDKIADAASIP